MKQISSKIKVLTLLIGFLMFPSSKAPAAPAENEIIPLECQIEANLDENYDYATVELWVPPGCQSVKGILCLVLHPLGKGGSKLAAPTPWINLAYRNNCALMAISFAQTDDTSRNWSFADQGTGRALLKALDTLAPQSHISNLPTAPIVIAGICAAGQFAYHAAAFAPNRIATFITIGGGKHDLTKVESADHIPAFIGVTPDRDADAVQNLNALCERGRLHSAPWMNRLEKISVYDDGNCSGAMIGFLQKTLANLETKTPFVTEKDLPSTENLVTLPISICGEKLPSLATVNPIKIALGNIDSLTGTTATFSFDVASSPTSPVDDIFIPFRDPALSAVIKPVSKGRWHVACSLPSNKLSLGPLHTDVPIRYLRKGVEILGGTTMSVTGSVNGELTSDPRALNFGQLQVGEAMETKVDLISKGAIPVKIGSIKSTLDWIHAELQGDNSLHCFANPPNDSRNAGFGGYLIIHEDSPINRSFRIFYFGVVK